MTVIDWTKPIECLNGRPARVLATDIQGSHSVAVAWQSEIGMGGPGGWTACTFRPDTMGAPFRNVRVKREGWVNVYRVHGKPLYLAVTGEVWPTKAMADEMGKRCPADLVDCIRVEWEEAP